jgi:hypothetical protein
MCLRRVHAAESPPDLACNWSTGLLGTALLSTRIIELFSELTKENEPADLSDKRRPGGFSMEPTYINEVQYSYLLGSFRPPTSTSFEKDSLENSFMDMLQSLYQEGQMHLHHREYAESSVPPAGCEPQLTMGA